MDMPPSRYKVVEHGRRLVVVDTWNGDRPVTRQPPRTNPPLRVPLPQTLAALRPTPKSRPADPAGIPDTIVTTQRWFDSKGPRRVRLAAGAQGVLAVGAVFFAVIAIAVILSWGWPVLAVLGFFLAQNKVRAALRTGVTSWLDTQQDVRG